MRILVVEDDLALQEQLQNQLRGEGFVVDAASDGEEGLYFGREYDYDAAVVDLGLPKLDGIEVITQLREEQRTFPVLILTARGDWQDKVQGLEAGADELGKGAHLGEAGQVAARDLAERALEMGTQGGTESADGCGNGSTAGRNRLGRRLVGKFTHREID